MKVTIEGTRKEIVNLVLAVLERRDEDGIDGSSNRPCVSNIAEHVKGAFDVKPGSFGSAY